MNITVEKAMPLADISKQLGDIRVIRVDPASIIKTCLQLSWENPARIWTFRTESEPPVGKLEAFMDKFEKVFPIHEEQGDYCAAWWTTTEEDCHDFIIKGLFADLNPSTGPDFFKRAADGPRLAIWFGRIQKIVM